MKKYIIGLIFIMVSALSYAQESVVVNQNFGQGPVPAVDSIYIKHPELFAHGLRGSFADTRLMYETYMMNKEVFLYQEKQVKGMVIGGTLMTLGTAGWIYTLLMDPAVYQTSNQAQNEEADAQKRKRLTAGLISTAVFTAGVTTFAISFKHHQRIRAEVGLNILKLEYNLFGKKRYFNPGQKAPRELKHWKSTTKDFSN